jgi:FkbM family methyltransferase
MRKDFYEFLRSSGAEPKKILHVGANAGQEASMYDQMGIEAWHVEAIPDIYNELLKACSQLNSQNAICACVSHEEGLEVEFNIASNSGLSSSVLELGRHQYAHPEVTYTGKIALSTRTIDGLIREGRIPADIDFLVLDVQGAEKSVLEGARLLLGSQHLTGCQIETSVVPLYDGGSTYIEISDLLSIYDMHLKQVEFNQMGWSDALYFRPYWPQQLGSEERQLIEVLRPKPSPVPLIRIGGRADGAYLLPNDLEGIKACYSPGVNNRKDFEDELLDVFGIDSHMCDHSSDPSQFKTALKPGQTFKKKWLDIDGSQDSISLTEWVQELSPDPRQDLILQMDIEGAEYRNILNTSDDVLSQFRIIVLELHGLVACNCANTFMRDIGQLLAKLDKQFMCVHAHPNNCSNEFEVIGSNLNLSNILEVTFLRRDRWKGVESTDCYAPMLPHPEDITFNSADEPPIFLNEHWQFDGVRSPESTIKLLTDKLDYLERASVRNNDTTNFLHLMALHAASLIKNANLPPSNQLLPDIAKGKHYWLSSQYGSTSPSGLIEAKTPFFFHTGPGHNQSITIDLECQYCLFELHVSNRVDMCQDRAKFLSYCVHDSIEPKVKHGLPMALTDEFFQSPPKKAVTNLRGAVGRYVTIFSPVYTMIHLSSICIYGVLVGDLGNSNIAQEAILAD